MTTGDALTIKECLRRANEARKKADRATIPEAKREYMEVAQLWQQLAAQMTRNNLTGLTHLQP